MMTSEMLIVDPRDFNTRLQFQRVEAKKSKTDGNLTKQKIIAN